MLINTGTKLLYNQFTKKIIIQINIGKKFNNWYDTSENNGYRNGCLIYLQYVNGKEQINFS